MFTSDNGFFYGEHRIPEQKTRPYEEALRVPLLIRVPDRYLGGAAVPRSRSRSPTSTSPRRSSISPAPIRAARRGAAG